MFKYKVTDYEIYPSLYKKALFRFKYQEQGTHSLHAAW